jgi:hypothetical protein
VLGGVEQQPWSFFLPSSPSSVALFSLANTGAGGGGGSVSSVFARTGAVTAQSGDYSVVQVTGAAPLASPALTGTPTAPTQTTGDNTTKIATGQFVTTAVAAEASRATTAEGIIAAAVVAETSRAEAAEALLAPLASPHLTGVPTAPTASPGTSTTQLATTAFAAAAFTALLPIAIVNTAYSPANGQYVPVDASGGSVTLTLPPVPADNTLIGAKLVKTAGSNVLVVNANGATFNAGVATSATFALLNQGAIFCYNTALNVWYVLADDLPLSGLDARYLLITGGAMQGPLSPAVAVLTDAATVAIDATKGNDFRLLLTTGVGGSRAIGAPSGLTDGQQFTVALTQPASGGPCTVTWDAVFDFGTAGAPTLSTAANAADIIGFKYYGGGVGKARFLGAGLGF